MKAKKKRCFNCKHEWKQHNTAKGEDTICLVDHEDHPNKNDFCGCWEFVTKKQFLMDKFKRRYILAAGYPLPHYMKGKGIAMLMQSKLGGIVHLKYPVDVPFDEKDSPRYRLVLERM